MTHLPSLAAMHRATAETLGPRVALRFKRDGLWHDRSWDDYRGQADAAAAGLIALGIGPGDRVGLLSENRAEWLIADIAILSAGAVGVPLHAPSTPPQCAYQLGHSEARGLIVSGPAQLSKVELIRDELPDLDWVVSFEPARTDQIPGLRTWPSLLGLGRADHARLRGELARREGATARDDLATIMYTSGTTGPPKGVMLTHGNLLANADGTVEAAGTDDAHVVLSWLPYSHIYARTCDHYASILSGATLCLSESIDTLVADLASTRPTEFNSVPRFYEKVWANVEGLPPDTRAATLRAVFGGRMRRLSSGGAPLPRHVAEGFAAAGLSLLEGYGLTECSPVISFNRIGAARIGTVGPPIGNVEVRIADDGEILTRGPHVMPGYWRDPDSTARAVVDGWLQTGDVGTLDSDGYLTITERKKDIIVTSGGKNIAPSELERLLTSDPLIDQAIVFGDGRPFVAALLVPNLPLLHEMTEGLGFDPDIRGDLVRGEQIRRLVANRVATAMEAVSRPERVRAFLLLGRPLLLDADEVTPTHKVRRRHILARFSGEIDALYAQAPPGRDESVS